MGPDSTFVIPNIMFQAALWMASLDRQLDAREPKHEKKATKNF